MAPWWWFPCKPKHIGAVFLVLKCFNNSTFFNVVCISWKLKCWVNHISTVLVNLFDYSFITAIELLGNPAEMYVYGTQFWMICIAFLLVIPITSQMYLPVYRHLKLTSAYEVSVKYLLALNPECCYFHFTKLNLECTKLWYEFLWYICCQDGNQTKLTESCAGLLIWNFRFYNCNSGNLSTVSFWTNIFSPWN